MKSRNARCTPTRYLRAAVAHGAIAMHELRQPSLYAQAAFALPSQRQKTGRQQQAIILRDNSGFAEIQGRDI
jgi:hypothetical protein